MSLVGSLREMPLAEVLTFLGRSEADGKLTLTSVGGNGVVVFRQGRVIYAASNSVRETFGSLLVGHGLFDQAVLLHALERQHRAREERRLGAILVEMGALPQRTVDDVIRQQLGGVVSELMSWRDGFFRFEPMGVGARGEVEVDARDFLLDEGIDPATLTGGAAPPPPAVNPFADLVADVDADPTVDFSTPDGSAGTAAQPGGTASPVTVRSFMSEPAAPWLTAEIAIAIMDCAAQALRRCVLFGVRGTRLVGMGGFGLAAPPGRSEGHVRTVSVRADVPSVLAFGLGTGEPYRGPLHNTQGDRDLVAQLGGAAPREVVVVPLVVGGKAVAVLYGDNTRDGGPIGSTAELESVVGEAAQAMSRAMASGR